MCLEESRTWDAKVSRVGKSFAREILDRIREDIHLARG